MTTHNTKTLYTGFIRLIGSVIYDWLILIGLMMLGGFVAVAVNKLITGNDAIAAGNPVFLIWNLLITFTYFVGFWLSKRQTVGMRAWRLHIESTDGEALNWKHASLRFFSAIPAWGLCMAGIFWRYLDADRRCWQDRYSHTQLIHSRKVKT